MEHTKHIIRAVLLLVLVTVGFILLRHFMYPQSFGRYGHYRYDNVAEYAAKEPMHADSGNCAVCHAEESEKKAAGKHVAVQCEVCHGPLALHVRADTKVADMPVNRSTQPCAWCHQQLEARPHAFPQVVLASHAIAKGAPSAQTACLECHNAHNPNE